MRKPVVIVGAGLAGLACARKLHQAGVPVLVLEADDKIGGRLKTDNVDGFLLDHGFQVHFTAYPSAARELDLADLGLESFVNGAQVFHGGKLHLMDEAKPLATLMGRFLNPLDLYKMRGVMGELAKAAPDSLHEESAEEMLIHHGLSADILDKFVRPFFGGIFLDKSLHFSSRQLAFLVRMLSEGSAALPKNGIAALPAQIASDLPSYLIRTRCRVEKVLMQGGKAAGVVLDTGEKFAAEAVVVATDAPVAQAITGLLTAQGRRSCVTIYYETPRALPVGKYLALNATPGALLNEVAPLSNVQPGYAPAGKHLVSATIIGERSESDAELDVLARKELMAMFPKSSVDLWRTIRTYRVSYAQYAQAPGFMGQLPSNQTDTEGLYFAGEFTSNSSIDGALQSGATCGNLLTRQLAAVPA